MTTIINQVGQKVEVIPYTKRHLTTILDPKTNRPLYREVTKVRVEILGYSSHVESLDKLFKDSEFNPVLLKDGSIIPYYKYNGQPIK